MRHRLIAQIVLGLCGLVLIVTAQNCSPSNFGDVPPPAIGLAPQGGEEEIPNDPPPVDPIPEEEIPVPKEEEPQGLPRLSFAGDACAANSECSKQAIITPADSRVIKIKWKTNESRALSRPDLFCQPNTGYMPAEGELVYQAGETQKAMQIQSKDCTSSDKEIPISIVACSVDGAAVWCGDLVN